jgi:hypothetical protein
MIAVFCNELDTISSYSFCAGDAVVVYDNQFVFRIPWRLLHVNMYLNNHQREQLVTN